MLIIIRIIKINMALLIILSDYSEINIFSFLILVIFRDLTRLLLDISLIYCNYSTIRLALWIAWAKFWSRPSTILLVWLVLYTRIKLTILYGGSSKHFLALVLAIS